MPARIYTAILMQESTYNQFARQATCGLENLRSEDITCVRTDIGIAQINYKTAIMYEYDMVRLVTDLEYGVNAGAEVLSWFHKNYAEKEPKRWWTRYNCGTKKSVFRNTCKTYYRKVNRWK